MKVAKVGVGVSSDVEADASADVGIVVVSTNALGVLEGIDEDSLGPLVLALVESGEGGKMNSV